MTGRQHQPLCAREYVRRENIKGRLKKLGLEKLQYLFLESDEDVRITGAIRFYAPFPLSLVQHFFPNCRWGWPEDPNDYEAYSLHKRRSWPWHCVCWFFNQCRRKLIKLSGKTPPEDEAAELD